METGKEPDTTSQIGRLMNRYMGRQMNSGQPKSRDTTSQPGRQMNSYNGRQMNWRQRKSWTPINESLYKETNEWEAGKEQDTTSQSEKQMNRIWGDKCIGDSQRAGHHQPDWETNESLYWQTNELETPREPDTASQIGRQMNSHEGRQMNLREPNRRTPPARLGDK